MMAVNLTRREADEVAHKLDALADNADLLAEYGIDGDRARKLALSVCAGEWGVADSDLETAVREEMADHARVLHGLADDCVCGMPGERASIRRLANAIATKFGASAYIYR